MVKKVLRKAEKFSEPFPFSPLPLVLPLSKEEHLVWGLGLRDEAKNRHSLPEGASNL